MLSPVLVAFCYKYTFVKHVLYSRHYPLYWRNLIYINVGYTELIVHWGRKTLKNIHSDKVEVCEWLCKTMKQSPCLWELKMAKQSLLSHLVS